MIIQPTAEDLITLLFRHKKFGIVTMSMVIMAGAAYLVLATPLYRSEASVVVRFDEKSVPDTNMAHDTVPEITAQNDRRETVLANAEILSSPDLARSVIESVGMEQIYPDILKSPPRLGTPLDEAVRIFTKNLNVEPGQLGNVIAISFEHRDPVLSQEVVRRLIAGYMKRESEIFSSGDFNFQQQQTEQARLRLVADQAALKAFKSTAGITSFEEEMTARIKQRSDLVGSLQNFQVLLGQARQRRDTLQTLLAKVSPSVQNSATGEKYHAVDDAETRLADLRMKEQQMLSTEQLHASIAVAQAEVRRSHAAAAERDSSAPNLVFQNIQTDLLRATAEARSFEDSVTVLQQQVTTLERSIQADESLRTQLRDLTRAVEMSDSAYRALAMHLADARVEESRVRDRISHAAVITQPSLPYRAARPRYVVMAIASVVAGLFAGVGSALFLELIDDRFTTVRQVEHQLGIPVLATFGERNW